MNDEMDDKAATQPHDSKRNADPDSGSHTAAQKRRKKDLGRKGWRRASAGNKDRGQKSTSNTRIEKPENGQAQPEENHSPTADQGEPEARRPKRKVAVMIGYSGTGYHGMQVNNGSKTIEGDLFAAFVAAGAISKANSDDPKKSSLVRCARTDKGVHAAGNVISLKLIIEDPDIVLKINNHLPSQIRVWGIERTNGSFSSYELCDSRIYEYLLPSHSLLPSHPDSHLGRKIQEYAEQKGDVSSLEERQQDVLRFWDDAEASHIKPVVDTFSPTIRQTAAVCPYRTAFAPDINAISEKKQNDGEGVTKSDESPEKAEPVGSLEAAARRLRSAYMEAKRSYRISPARLERLREVLGHYCGTHNFHNYTVNKNHRDPSARRHIISFRVDEPLLIGGTEWLSLKVHGQSFMMHQIRKMVSMAALVVRTGCPPIRIKESYGAPKIIIPKAPGLGLLLERPVFDKYNERAVEKLQRSKIDFGNYAADIEAFKQKMIYEQIFQEEEKGCHFHALFHHIDNFVGKNFLYLTSAGIDSAQTPAATDKSADAAAPKDLTEEAPDEAASNEDDGALGGDIQ